MSVTAGLFYELEVRKGIYSETEMFDNALTQIARAEEVGFDSAFAVEHHFTPGYSHSSCPEIFFTAASQRTSRMRLGPGVCLLPFNNPIRTAERYAMLDCLSHGRLEMGVGRGVTPMEFAAFHQPAATGDTRDQNRRLFFEYADIIKKCWTENDVTYKGEFYSIPEPISVVPKPYQKPHPRLWAACGSPDSFEVYPRMGFHVMPQTAVKPQSAMEADLERAYRAWDEAGHNQTIGPLQVSHLVPVHVASTRKKAMEQMKDYEVWYFTELQKYFTPTDPAQQQAQREAFPWWEKPTWENILEQKMVVVGDPDDCIKQIKELEATGVTRVMAQFQVGGMPHDMVMESIEVFGKHVIPSL